MVERKTSSSKTPPVNDNSVNIIEGRKETNEVALVSLNLCKCSYPDADISFSNPAAFFALLTQAASFDRCRSRDHSRTSEVRHESRVHQPPDQKNDRPQRPDVAPCQLKPPRLPDLQARCCR